MTKPDGGPAMTVTYRGRPIHELTREELIAALEFAYGEAQRLRDRADRLFLQAFPKVNA